MNYQCAADFFAGWGEAVCYGRLSQPTTKMYNTACVFKRPVGQGKVRYYEGLDTLLARFGEHIPLVDLNRSARRGATGSRAPSPTAGWWCAIRISR